MTGELPLWLSIAVSACVLLGALLTMVGCIGLVRLQDFYRRIHAPTMGTSMGGGLILISSALYFSFTGQRLVLHEVIIFLFITVTTPVTLMLLARATMFRDRVEQLQGLAERTPAEQPSTGDTGTTP
jgi:multicomponent K+:H+ antiporter subunit G